MKKTTLAVWPVEEGCRVFPMDEPPRRPARGWGLCAAGGEYVTLQLGIRTDAPLKDVAVTVSPLRRGPQAIPAEAAQIRWVGLIPVPHDAFWATGAERPELVPGWYPDPLLEQPPVSGES